MKQGILGTLYLSLESPFFFQYNYFAIYLTYLFTSFFNFFSDPSTMLERAKEFLEKNKKSKDD